MSEQTSSESDDETNDTPAGESGPASAAADSASPGGDVEAARPDDAESDDAETDDAETLEAAESAAASAAPSKADKQIAKAEAKAAKARAKAERARARAEKGPTEPWTDADGGRDWKALAILATGVAALVAAITCLGFFGYYGITAYVKNDGAAVTLRDESVDVAEQAIINSLNIDPEDIDGWIKRVQSTMTGEALEQTQGESVQALRKQVEAAGETPTAEISAVVNRAAATEVNVDENWATVLVFATATAKADANAPGEAVPMEFLVTVVEADGTRKVNKVVPLHVIRGLEDQGDVEQGDAGEQGGSGEQGDQAGTEDEGGN
ncbi:hypothetical protein [Gordonia iterans]